VPILALIFPQFGRVEFSQITLEWRVVRKIPILYSNTLIYSYFSKVEGITVEGMTVPCI